MEICIFFLLVDAFTKFTVLRAVKSTKVKHVIEVMREVCSTYGSPSVLISDQGACFTSHQFRRFCKENRIQHIKIAVATPRANGQAERVNRSIKSALLTTATDEKYWDDYIRNVQLAINCTENRSTGKTPSELLFGYVPRHNDEIKTAARDLNELLATRQKALSKIEQTQQQQKRNFDKRRKAPKTYKVGDLVVIEKQVISTTPGGSHKMLHPYSGPMVVQQVIPNDRYRAADMGTSKRVTRKSYNRVVAVDRMKPWATPGGVSDDTDDDSGKDDTVLSSCSDSE